MALMPVAVGIPGYVLPLVIITAGYAVFQAANNTAVMSEVTPNQRGVVSGLLNLSRNLGLITGASAMGAIYALGRSLPSDGAPEISAASNGMRLTFWMATMLILGAIGVAMSGARSHNEKASGGE
jgi:hypothetical protein